MNEEAVQEVAQDSRAKAETYLSQGNWGRAFAHLLLCVKLKPEWKSDLQNTISNCLCCWGEQLEKEGRHQDLLHCYQQALECYPEDHEVLNNLGAHLFRSGHLKEAREFFEKALEANKEFLPAAYNLENVSSVLVERWHFRMLNDSLRNESYREAIVKKIRQGYRNVLDIGTGTSLLSLYAVSGGAARVSACDCSPAMIEIADKVIKENGAAEKIDLIPKVSNELEIPQDLPSRVSLVVTETMDAGMLGENILQTLLDAWDRLLLPACPNLITPKDGRRTGIVIPYGGTIYLAGVQCPFIARSNYVSSVRWDTLNLGQPGLQLARLKEEDYDSEDITRLPGGYLTITSPTEILKVNFNDPRDIKSLLNSNVSKQVELISCEAGQVDAFVSWFVLQVDEDLRLSSEPGQDSCWEQAIFSLNQPIELTANQKINVEVSAYKGALKAQLPQPQPDFKLSSDVIAFLNDEAWVDSLKHQADTFEGKSGLSILDLSAFPYLGILLLKKGVAKHVAHTCPELDFIGALAPSSKIQFIEDVSLLKDDEKFNIIVTNPVTANGELNQESLLNLPRLRRHLKAGGEFIPKSLSIVGQLWNSPWLDSVSKLVSDENVSGFKIADHVNKYQLSRHLDLNLETAPHTALSQPISLFSRDFCDNFDGQTDTFVTADHSGTVTAIAFWFEFGFSVDSKVSTNRADSYLRQAAVLIKTGEAVITTENILLMTKIQEGVFDVQFKTVHNN